MKELYLDENEKELEKSDKQVADILNNIKLGISNGLMSQKTAINEIPKLFEIKDDLLGLLEKH